MIIRSIGQPPITELASGLRFPEGPIATFMVIST